MQAQCVRSTARHLRKKSSVGPLFALATLLEEMGRLSHQAECRKKRRKESTIIIFTRDARHSRRKTLCSSDGERRGFVLMIVMILIDGVWRHMMELTSKVEKDNYTSKHQARLNQRNSLSSPRRRKGQTIMCNPMYAMSACK